MRDNHDNHTMDLAGKTVKRGRPVTGNALSAAERQQKFRERQKAKIEEDAEGFAGWSDEQLLEASSKKTKIAKQCWLEYGRRRGWV